MITDQAKTIVGSLIMSYFYPTLVHGLGFSTRVSQYMTTPIYLAAFVAMMIVSIYCDKYPHNRGIVIMCCLGIAMICGLAVCLVYNYTARYLLLVFMASGLWAANGTALSFAAETFGRLDLRTRAVSLAVVNGMGNLAQIYGAYLFPVSIMYFSERKNGLLRQLPEQRWSKIYHWIRSHLEHLCSRNFYLWVGIFLCWAAS